MKVQLYNVHVEPWTEDSLSYIASGIGNVLYLNEATSLTIAEFASMRQRIRKLHAMRRDAPIVRSTDIPSLKCVIPRDPNYIKFIGQECVRKKIQRNSM